ncbi:hypothetical protein [Archangium gephyra]
MLNPHRLLFINPCPARLVPPPPGELNAGLAALRLLQDENEQL